MRKLTFLLTFFMLLGSVQLQAKEYAIKDIPMVHLQNRTRYVSNPDGILSSTAVTTMDSILYALEQKTGIQTLVVAVTGIEGGDCFDFAHRLGQETGVGQKEREGGDHPRRDDLKCAPRLPGCGTQHPHRALGGTRVLLAAAPTTPPCFRRWRRSSSLLPKWELLTKLQTLQ